jgi:hypothetical protein
MSYINEINIQKFVRIKEQLRIINDNNGPALIINQTGTENILDIQQNSNTVFYIENEGNVGIGTNNPSTKLDVNGIIKGDGSQITNLNYNNITNQPALDNVSDSNFDNKFSYKSTNDLIEGINLYYTEERVNQNILSKNLISLTEENLNSNQLVYYDGESWYNLKIDPRSLEITTDRVLRVIGGTSSGNLNQVVYENETTTVTSNLEKPIVLKTDMSEEREYPPAGKRDFVPTSGTDLSYTKTISHTYGSGDYTISVSSYDPDYPVYNPIECFNEADGVAGIWLINNYTDGIYNKTESFDGGTYTGEWIKIKLPVHIQLTKIKIKQRSTFLPDRCPGDFKIYGSNDDTNWTVVVDKSGINEVLSSDFTSYEYETTSVLTNIEYNYFVLVVNKTVARSGNVVLNFDEWYIYGKENFDRGLIAHYKFDGDLTDETADNVDLSVVNNVNGYSFVDDYINVTGDTRLQIPKTIFTEGQTELTIGFWCAKISGTESTGNHILRYKPVNLMIRYNYQNNGKINLLMEGKDAYYTIDLSQDIFTHILFTVNGETHKIYVNGEEVNWTSISGNSTMDSNGFTHGTSSDKFEFFSNPDASTDFRGKIKNFRIYDRELSASEVEKLYNEQYNIQKGQITDSTDEYIIFKYNPNTAISGQTEYTINFPEETECEILLLDDTKYKHLETPLESLTGTYTVKVGTTESSISNSTYNKTSSSGTSISSGYSTDITGTTQTYSSKEVIIRYKTTKESTVTTTGASNPILSSLSSLTPETNSLLYFNTSNTVNYLDVDTNSLQITGDYKLKVVDNKYLEITDGINSLSENELELSKHLIPESNAIYDIGSIEKKIRHMFISDNSLWVGDDNKLSLKDGKMRIKKRKKTVIPSRLKQLDPTINETKILSSLNKENLKDLNLKDWNTYLRNNHQEENLIATDLFENDDDYELDAATDAWLASTSNNIIIDDSYSNIGIGKLYPTKKLDVNGDINMSGSIYLNDELISTTNINEGINKYYSEERVDSNIASKKLISFNSTATDKDILYYRNGNWNGLKLDPTTLEITTDNKLKVIGGGGGGTQVLIQNESDTITSNLEKPIIDSSNLVTEGLIAHYKFDGNLTDSSGNNNHLEVVVSGHTYPDGVYDEAVLFASDTTTELRTINNFQQINQNTSFSVSTWVKLTNNNTHFIFSWGTSGNNGDSIGLIWESTGKIQNYNWGYTTLETTNTFTDTTKYYFVVLTRTAGSQKIYVDGVLEDSFTNTQNFDTGTSKLYIGHTTIAAHNSANYLDDFRIYDRVLSAAEVEKLYNSQYIQKGSIPGSTDEYIAFKYNPNTELRFVFRTDETPYSWQEAYDEAIANGGRMATKTELLAYLSGLGYTLTSPNNQTALYVGDQWVWVSASNAIGKDAIQIGDASNHYVGKSHYDNYSSTTFYGPHTNSYANIYLEVYEYTEYNINFPQATDCEILLLDDTNYKHLETPLETLNGTYTVKVGVSESSISNSIYTKTTTGGILISSGYSTDIKGTTQTYSSKEVIIRYKTQTVTTVTRSDPKLSSLSSLTPELNSLLYFNTSNTINYLELDPTTLEITTDNKLKVIGGTSSDGSGTQVFIQNESDTITSNLEKPIIDSSNLVTEGLIAHYKFDDSTNIGLDSAGSYNLTNNGATYTSTYVIDGDAVYFDNKADDLQFPTSFNPYTIWNGNGIALSFWFRLESVSDWARFFDFAEQTSNATNGFAIFFSNNSNELRFYTTATTFTYSSSTLRSNLNVWHHLVWSIETNADWNIYLDNVKINGSENGSIPNPSTWGHRYLNKSTYIDTGGQAFTGQIEDFRIYDRVLSAAEVEKLYNAQYIQKGLITDSTEEVVSFKYNSNNDNGSGQTEYTINFPRRY